MDTTPLGVFASKARASNRLLYGDLRRLQRDVLPTGARSREEIEVLLIARLHRARGPGLAQISRHDGERVRALDRRSAGLR